MFNNTPHSINNKNGNQNENQPESPKSSTTPVENLIPDFLNKFDVNQLESYISNFVGSKLDKLGLESRTYFVSNRILNLIRENEVTWHATQQSNEKEELTGSSNSSNDVRDNFNSEEEMQESWNEIETLSDSVCSPERGHLKTILDHLIQIEGSEFASSLGLEREVISAEEELFLKGILAKSYLTVFRLLVVPFDRVNERILVSLIRRKGEDHPFWRKYLKSTCTRYDLELNDPELIDVNYLTIVDEELRRERWLWLSNEDWSEQFYRKWKRWIFYRSQAIGEYIAREEFDKVNSEPAHPHYWTIFSSYDGNTEQEVRALCQKLVYPTFSKIAKELRVLIEQDSEFRSPSSSSVLEPAILDEEKYFYEKRLRALAVINKLRLNLSALREQAAKHYSDTLEELSGKLDNSKEETGNYSEQPNWIPHSTFQHDSYISSVKEEINDAGRKERERVNLSRRGEKWSIETKEGLRAWFEGKIIFYVNGKEELHKQLTPLFEQEKTLNEKLDEEERSRRQCSPSLPLEESSQAELEEEILSSSTSSQAELEGEVPSSSTTIKNSSGTSKAWILFCSLFFLIAILLKFVITKKQKKEKKRKE